MEIHEPEDLNIDYLVNYWSYLSFDRFENVAIFTNSYLKMNSKFNGRIIHTILIIKLFAICTTTDARKKIERFVNVNSDIYVTASLPDLRHSHHTSLRLGQCKRVYF